MPQLIVDDVPAEVYEHLQRRAAEKHLSLQNETLLLLKQALGKDHEPKPRLPELIPSEEFSAPCDLPRSSQPVKMLAHPGQPRLPDPLVPATPE